MKDKLNISIKLAGHPAVAMRDVTPAEEEVIREAEYNINRLWKSWCKKFADKTPDDVLAMVAFRFAQLYFTHIHKMEELDKALDDLDRHLDRMVMAE